ncbi:helix-turn-helix domain-containing protein [Streptosporangium sp. NBC_01756]|uniref:helix-turn-helix domain-containing protein n=1 Tax=Streptosporangium sp. NBC_01756 TaxID=2975950 RepID=UPI002DDAA3EE|nr:helix-turn-helix domain-containing protein [Streptosporangium sp. NBC_01756]WSC84810.1 helix-turn-helix domain-containing protein [Streptosporangium sp. NBC_01756]
MLLLKRYFSRGNVIGQDLVGQRIKNVRRQRGFSQAQLAHPELSDSYVSLIESGKRTPTPAVLELLAEKLDCSLTYLINGVTAEQMEEIELALRYARLALDNGEVAEARARYAELLDDSGLVGLPQVRQDAEYGLALATHACGDLEAAIALLDGLRRRPSAAMAPERHVSVAIALSRSYRESGDLLQAVRVAEDILGGAVRPVWSEGLIELGTALLAAYAERGDLLRAHQFGAELLAAAELVGTPRATVLALWAEAIVAAETGRLDEAVSLANKALAIYSENGDSRGIAGLRIDYAQILLMARPAEVAACRDMLIRVESELQESSIGATFKMKCAHHLARAELMLGHPERAREHIQSVLNMIEDMPKELQTEARLLAGETMAELDLSEEASRQLTAVADLLEQAPPTRQAAHWWLSAAQVLERIDEPARSVDAYQRALACVGL